MLLVSDSRIWTISQTIVHLYVCLLAFVRGEVITTTTTTTATTSYLQKPPVCQSEIYCHGNLLHTIQLKGIYSDSKKFVDKKMKYESARILDDFQALLNRTNNDPNITILNEFIDRNFESGSEFESWVPEDLNLENLPSFIDTIGDERLRDWVIYLIEFWKSLGRKFKDDVRVNSHLYSAIYVPNPVIVPGGRFLEFYYWDSYWIIKGLLLSNMFNTSKGMIENFLYIVNKYKFIPNGGRIYYLNRSQPPLLIPMFKAYFDATQDIEFLSDSLSTLEKEYDYWISKHMIVVEKNNRSYSMAIYRDNSRGPRPESYKEDYHSAKIFQTDEEKENFYSNIKAAAESGWDFSTRWFILNSEKSYEKGNLTDTKTQSIVPVDLNSILYQNSKILAHFNRITNNKAKSEYYERKAAEFLEAVTNVLWHPEIGAWLDYDFVHKERRNNFYPSNIFPLWTNCYDMEKKDEIVANVLDYLKRTQVTIFLGGVPTSLFYSSEQWDYPLAWPPLQYIMIMGLDNTGIEEAKQLAYNISKIWINSNYEAFKQKNLMFEKYDASVFGSSGDGGEYHVQDGFGWTNGIIIELLSKYGSLMYDEAIEESEISQFSAADQSNSKRLAQNAIILYLILMPTIVLITMTLSK